MKLRVFYKDNTIVWTSTTDNEFPYSVEEYVKDTPQADGCEWIELTDKETIDSFLISDNNSITKRKLIIGEPRPIPEPVKSRDLAKEIDELKSRLDKQDETIAAISVTTSIGLNK
jgi:hypothetical protein